MVFLAFLGFSWFFLFFLGFFLGFLGFFLALRKLTIYKDKPIGLREVHALSLGVQAEQ